jgi:hypothetical protein
MPCKQRHFDLSSEALLRIRRICIIINCGECMIEKPLNKPCLRQDAPELGGWFAEDFVRNLALLGHRVVREKIFDEDAVQMRDVTQVFCGEVACDAACVVNVKTFIGQFGPQYRFDGYILASSKACTFDEENIA